MPTTAFLYPGQGSQRVGMGRHLVEHRPELERTHFRLADEILGFGLTELCWDGPADELGTMPVTQPAVFLVSVATQALLRAHGMVPDVVAGHSLGEFAAMVAAGVLDWTDGLRLVRARGELMSAVNDRVVGKMGAIVGLDVTTVEGLCARARATAGVVDVANHNDPRQMVVSGQVDAVDRVLALAESAGAERVLTLEVGGPAHSSLLAPIEAEFAAAVERTPLRDPVVPVLSAVAGGPVRTAQEAAASLVGQLTGRVRWAGTVEAMAASGVTRFVEVGPGKALANICGRMCPEATTLRTGDARQLERLLAAAPAAVPAVAGAS